MKNFLKKSLAVYLPDKGRTPNTLGMRLTSFSSVIRQRLAVLGLAQLPAVAVAYIEAQMLKEVAKTAARKITARFVAASLLKSSAKCKPAPETTPDAAAVSPKPQA